MPVWRSSRCAMRVKWLAALAILAPAILQPCAAASWFQAYTNWTQQCGLGGSLNSSCQSSTTIILDFTYAVVLGKISQSPVGTAQLTSACRLCSSALDAALATVLPTSDPAACPLLPSRDQATLLATALRRFVCWGATPLSVAAAGGSPEAGGGGGAGSCVVDVTNALTRAGVLEAVRTLDGSLRFSGSVLRDVCATLTPLGGDSCCGRSWAYLMAAIATQSCLPDLAREYIALPGRCEALQNRTVPGFCEADWATFLLPLLTPLSASRCSLAPGLSAGLTALAGGVVPAWTRGSACSTDQLRRLRCPSTTCDLWCGVVGRMQEIENAPPPPPATLQEEGGGLVPAAPRSGEGLHTATIAIVCVFSVLIAGLLVALALWFVAVRREKKEAERETFAFDNTLAASNTGTATSIPTAAATAGYTSNKSLPSSKPPAPTASASLAAGRTSGGSVSASAASGSGAPATPLVARGGPLPAAAAAAAAAGGITRTPRYQPGNPPGRTLSASSAGRSRLGSRSGSLSYVAAGADGASTEAGAGVPSGPLLAVTLAAADDSAAAATAADGSDGRTSAPGAAAAAATAGSGQRTAGAARALDFSGPAAAAGGGGGGATPSTKYGSAASLAAYGGSPSTPTVYATPEGSEMAPGGSEREASVATLDRLRSHRVSLSGSDTSAATAEQRSGGHSAQRPDSGQVTAEASVPEVGVVLGDDFASPTRYVSARSHFITVSPQTGSASTSAGGSYATAPGPSAGGAAPSRLQAASRASAAGSDSAASGGDGDGEGDGEGTAEDDDPVRMPLPSLLTELVPPAAAGPAPVAPASPAAGAAASVPSTPAGAQARAPAALPPSVQGGGPPPPRAEGSAGAETDQAGSA